MDQYQIAQFYGSVAAVSGIWTGLLCIPTMITVITLCVKKDEGRPISKFLTVTTISTVTMTLLAAATTTIAHVLWNCPWLVAAQ